jgi:envelope integrity protein A
LFSDDDTTPQTWRCPISGRGSKDIASIVEKAVGQWGKPNGYILGEEAGGAFIGGSRHGSGTLYTKNITFVGRLNPPLSQPRLRATGFHFQWRPAGLAGAEDALLRRGGPH